MEGKNGCYPVEVRVKQSAPTLILPHKGGKNLTLPFQGLQPLTLPSAQGRQGHTHASALRFPLFYKERGSNFPDMDFSRFTLPPIVL